MIPSWCSTATHRLPRTPLHAIVMMVTDETLTNMKQEDARHHPLVFCHRNKCNFCPRPDKEWAPNAQFDFDSPAATTVACEDGHEQHGRVAAAMGPTACFVLPVDLCLEGGGWADASSFLDACKCVVSALSSPRPLTNPPPPPRAIMPTLAATPLSPARPPMPA